MYNPEKTISSKTSLDIAIEINEKCSWVLRDFTRLVVS